MTQHAIFDRPLDAETPHGLDQAIFGMGCYWGAERLFWQQTGVWLTQAGFAGGDSENPTYDQVKTGQTDHAEVVRVIYDSSLVSYDHLLQMFWENHNPTLTAGPEGDKAFQYRSLIMTFNDLQAAAAKASKIDYDNRLAVDGKDKVVTQIIPQGMFWPAKDEHQQYLAKHPNADGGLHGTGVQASMPNPDPI